MTDLALHRAIAEGVIAEAEGVIVTALAPERLTLLVRATPAALPPAAGGMASEPNRVSSCADGRMLWLRPGAWLLISHSSTHTVPPGTTRLLDVSHTWAAFRVAGSHMRDLLARGTALDLRPGAFAEGQCARTWCAGFTVLIEAVGDALIVRIDIALAQAFAAWLVDAAAGFARGSA